MLSRDGISCLTAIQAGYEQTVYL